MPHLASTDPSRRTRYLKQIGWIAETKDPLFFADPIEDAFARDSDEAPEGLPVYRHPEAMLAEEPELWDPIERYRLGYARERADVEWFEFSNFEVEVLNTCREVSMRAEIAAMKRRHHG